VTPLPGTTYETRDSSGVSGPPLDTATALIVGLAERGRTDKPVFVQSLPQFEAEFGGEVSYGWLWWAAKLIPQEGGAGIWIQRVVGPSAKLSTIKFTDGSGNVLQADAVSAGAWGDSIKVKIAASGGGFTVSVYFAGVLKESETFLTNAEAVAWAKSSSYVRLTQLGEADPITAEKSLAGGDDDRSNVTDTERKAGIDLLAADLGPGQVLYPGATTTAVYTKLLENAEARNRTALLDGADTPTVATLTAAAATLRALGTPARCGGIFVHWAVVPGSASSTTKTIPYSIIQAALCARRDAETFDAAIGVANPNEPAAGTHNNAGVSRIATGLSQPAWSDIDRETLNNAGVNVARYIYEKVVTYGYRTLTNPTTDKINLLLNNRRIDMAIIARSLAVGEEFNFRQVDGRGKTLSDYGSALNSRVLLPYLEVGALFESSEGAEDAYAVKTDETVNPPEQLAEGLVEAEIDAKRSPFAERTKTIYVRRPL
jgi:hypothetical protein